MPGFLYNFTLTRFPGERQRQTWGIPWPSCSKIRLAVSGNSLTKGMENFSTATGHISTLLAQTIGIVTGLLRRNDASRMFGGRLSSKEYGCCSEASLHHDLGLSDDVYLCNADGGWPPSGLPWCQHCPLHRGSEFRLCPFTASVIDTVISVRCVLSKTNDL